MPASPVTPGGDPTYTNGSQSTGNYSQSVGNYSNLPPGFSNAGGRGGPGQTQSAYTRQVQPNELSSYQLQGLLASDSPYIQQAQQAGMNVSNDRGLLNSSIAAGNSEGAAIQAAAPIAAQDAAAYGTAAGQNEDALNTILATGMNNRSSEANARTAAGASMYGADIGLLNNRENRTYEGQQAGINRNFQDYMTQQGYGNQMRLAAFGLGGQLMQGSQSFNNQLMLQASQNPFMMADPQALQGFQDFANQGVNSYYDDLFNYSMNGGQDLPQWQENDNWYNSPDYSQQYGDGTYVGGSPQLPYTQQPNYYGNGSP